MSIPHPYEAEYKARLYLDTDKTNFSLRGNTYPLRHILSNTVKATWSPTRKLWILNKEAAKYMLSTGTVVLILQVRIPAHCHEPAQIVGATHKEIQCGFMRVGCNRCDTPAVCGDVVKIEEIVENDLAKIFDISLGSSQFDP